MVPAPKSGMTTAVKRACDGCHRRKVKCDSNTPCRNCAGSQLECTYLAIPQKKGPKGSRAKVITELRDNQRQASLAAKVHNRLNGGPPTDHNVQGLTPSVGLLSQDLIKSCMNYYFDNCYAALPFLDRTTLEQVMPFMETGRDHYCLFASLCAYVLLQPGMTLPTSSAEDSFNLNAQPGANIIASNLLIEECLRVRKGTDYFETPNLNILATNLFIYACYKMIDGPDRAWYYLREATTMILSAGMDKEEHYGQFGPAESVRRRRLFWYLFASERVYSFLRRRPVSLQATIAPSQMGDDPTDGLYPQLDLFFHLVEVFRPMDDIFLGSWRKGCDHLDVQQTTVLLKQLQEWQSANPYPAESASFSSQQFLNSALWQLNNQQSQYPVQRMISEMASSFPTQPLELAKSCLFPKLFEICANLITLLSRTPRDRNPLSTGPQQWLQDLLSLIEPARLGETAFTPLLLAKVNEILPRLADPQLRNAPESAQFAMSADIFDGFGNAGMAQMPPMNDYNQGMAVDEYDTKYDMSGSSPDSIPNSTYAQGGTPPGSQPGNDMASAFVSSPSTVMSPGLDYNVNMGGFNMPEMGMNSFAGGQPNPMNNMQHQQRMGNQNSMQQGMHNQNVNNPMTPSMNQMYGVQQQPQRQSSYQMQNQSPLSGMGSIPDMDFTMR
ncbi:hypothetical protein F53441_707 [Fusarium austroafricanum]|uniref:Zn(2)-C6 fungal-type domain-containing protein n=1 Tax=Fusarium austroafricanum TaxID=2364996 RepID=A0A8H4KXW8_9HYPO|nr:hypothetical protein F53441_707 [Fusarium austroafricanum]